MGCTKKSLELTEAFDLYFFAGIQYLLTFLQQCPLSCGHVTLSSQAHGPQGSQYKSLFQNTLYFVEEFEGTK